MPPRPRETFFIEVARPDAEEVLLQRLRPLLRACVWSERFTESLMLSCYLQGAMDGNQRNVQKALDAVRGEEGK